SLNTLKADNWLSSFEDAKKIALATNKLVLVDFWASWCGPCKRMDAESWNKDEVKVLMNNYVAVKIDLDINKSLALKYGVKGIPYVFIMDGNGKVIYEQMGYKRKSEVMELLKTYALDTEFLNRDLINYHKKESFANTYRLACKYQDYSMYLEAHLKSNFLEASDVYFKEAEKALKDSKVKNKQFFEQRIELHDIQKNLILNKSKKALKQLERISKKGIDDKNISFYNFLQYIANKDGENIEERNLLSKELSDNDLKKAALFFRS
ncbi:MAG: thioredoxin family protein, partial [Bizionia sp.]|nr:thioredoxin family protein [Bizionia sp.]